ncbi:MAG: hypothetical protein ACREPD_11885 [Stenotrophomonas sp.]|uniref:hypothetical protein n=1 Tax=Stenotrophomonas sp. TaxID=69392 RepID=UPI003D6D8999
MLSALFGCSQQGPDASSTAAAPSGADPGAAKAAAVTAAAAAHPAPAFAETAPGIAIDAVPGMTLHRDFTRSYLAMDRWAVFAPPDLPGTPLAALVLDGSNEVTSAELRVGRSDDPAAIAACLTPSAEATRPTRSVDIDGVAFTHFSASDAAMSHYVSVDSYRAVQHGRCYAIDLVVAGTQPDVYDPPRSPPFSNDDAKQKLSASLNAVHWVD